ncbi:cytochrome p450 [Fusarium subglutinans]|uniref:Cytochrome p450 n=1 Tax=Gibberella subglutinans TaxID=42677 RepID=A0A8H5PE86_GIBSU|nr:cytochrome p450 [Fusarium subglutinans]KAF5594892.1 cytochrome p450 [Fusarium subglutinans]
MLAAADSHQPVQDYESKKLLVSLLETPASYEKWFERYASGVVFRIGFGKWIETCDEPAVKRIIQVVHNLERVASPGAYLVDSMPVLNSLPEVVAPFKKEGRRLHEEELSLFRELQSDVRRGLQKGSGAQSFTRTFLENKDSYQLSDDEGAYVIGTLFEAGSGTTAATMMSYCLAMCHFTEWQRKIQGELDEQVHARLRGSAEPSDGACCYQGGAAGAPCHSRWVSSPADQGRRVRRVYLQEGDDITS